MDNNHRHVELLSILITSKSILKTSSGINIIKNDKHKMIVHSATIVCNLQSISYQVSVSIRGEITTDFFAFHGFSLKIDYINERDRTSGNQLISMSILHAFNFVT